MRKYSLIQAKSGWVAFALAAAVTAGCGAGGGGSVTPPAGRGIASAAAQSVRVKIAFPVTQRSFRRKRAFVSPATSGLDVAVYLHPQSSDPAPISHVTADVGSASTNCSADPGGTRTCTVALPITTGTYDFTLTLYDAAPAAGSFSGAHELASGSVTKTIVRNADNVVSASFEGTIASLVLSPGRQTFALARAATLALGVTPLDADLDTILAGAADPYQNPITLTIADTGGSHTLLSLNGGTPVASITSSQLSDRIAAVYDGKGTRGYFATISASASGVAAAAGGLDSFYESPAETDFTTFGATATITLDEPHATGPFMLQSVQCGGVATSSPVQGSGEVQTFTITAATANGTCNYLASNEDLTQTNRDFVDLYTPGPVPSGVVYSVPGGSLGIMTGYKLSTGAIVQNVQADPFTNMTTLKSSTGVARDPSGNIYVSDLLTQSIAIFNPTVNDNMAPRATIAGSNTLLNAPRLVRIDHAGSIYALNSNGTITVYPAGSSGNVAPVRTVMLSGLTGSDTFYGLAIDSSGNLYTLGTLASDPTNSGTLYEILAGSSGQAVASRTITGSNTTIAKPRGVALDAAGNVYVTSDLYDNFSEFGPSQSGNAVPIFSSAQELNQPSNIVIESDGTVVTTGLSPSGEYVVTYPPGSQHAATQFLLYAADSSFSDLAL